MTMLTVVDTNALALALWGWLQAQIKLDLISHQGLVEAAVQLICVIVH